MINAQQPGSFSDVTYHDGVPHLVRPADGFVHVERFDAGFTLIAKYPCEGSAFPRILSTPVGLCIIYRPGDGLSVIWRNLSVPCIVCAGVTTVANPEKPDEQIKCPACLASGAETRVYPVAFGANWPCALGPNGYVVNDLHGRCTSYTHDGQLAHDLDQLPGTGVARLDSMNYPVSCDANQFDQFDEWQMQKPQYAGRLFVGENQEGGVACVLDNTIKTVLNIYTETFEPKVAKHPDRDEWAVVTTGKGYAVMTLFSGITPADVGVQPPPVDHVDPPPVLPPVTQVIRTKPGDRIEIFAEEG